MNYATLVSNIENFTEDNSSELTASIDQIISQAEEMIFQRLPNLPCFRQSVTKNLSTAQPEYTIANARMIRQVAYVTNSASANGTYSYLDHRVDSYVRDYWPNPLTYDQSLIPIMYSTNSAGTAGTVITLAPTPAIQASDAENTIQVDYIAPAAGLTSSNTTTWLGDHAENLLLAACLYETSAFLKDANTLTLYKQQFDESVQLFQQEMLRDYTAEYNGGI